MKKKLLVVTGVVCMCAFSALHAQDMTTTSKDHYSVYGGLLGGANYSNLRVTDKPSGLSTDWRWDWAAGIFVGFPIGKTISLEPQALFSRMGGKFTQTGIKTDNQLDYLSVPVLVKLHAGKYFDFMVGPQFDFLMSAKDKEHDKDIKDNIKKNDFALTAGFELFPRHVVSFYARYIHGFNKVYEDNTGLSTAKVYNQGVQAGLKVKLFGKHVKATTPPPPPPPPPAPLDSDNDGIPDSEDKCPNQAGVAKYGGCPIPDSDGDGINDEEDKCPQQAGVAKYNGCPIPDSDGDGINDEEDKCPQQAGVAKYNGCPIPDTDGDGVNDEEDKCPTIAGVKENNGCPAIEKFSASAVQFVSGSATLTKGGNAALSQLVFYMKKYPETKVEINGYTDNTGKPEANQKLSEKRAAAAKTYLTKKGISGDRVTTNGYGDASPIADNGTKEGKAKNRRVEFKVSQ
ncbi:OmpA family protein [Pinibacter aurantiacus]|uniref:OmpA family protein n=1 Tax=Pinibacter aurantiacus TaxID=2851599 RepID=A0A9E2SAZ7_9BACT|nr:OmpA family protein [Pinibacter aurantiacus]MBV4357140.1 OmpA family protein [Pinibacter aurantiacus]